MVQSIIAAEVGYRELALRYFHNSLFVDLADLHDNTADGVHVASTGGVWNVSCTASAACGTTTARSPSICDYPALDRIDFPDHPPGHPGPGEPDSGGDLLRGRRR